MRDPANVVVAVISASVFAAAFLWLCGSFLLRLFGIAHVVFAAGTAFWLASAGLFTHYPIMWWLCPLTAAHGAGMWLAGHWLLAKKRGRWTSPLARRFWTRTLLGGRLSPGRRGTVRAARFTAPRQVGR